MSIANSISIEITSYKGHKTGAHIKLCQLGNNYSLNQNSIQLIPVSEARLHGEAPLQVLEGIRYEYELSDPSHRIEVESAWANNSDVINQSKLSDRQHCGIFNPGLSTGTIRLIISRKDNEIVGFLDIEVRSRKLGYRSDYQEMLSDITNNCIELIQDWKSASKFNALPQVGKEANTIGQQFSFIRSLISSVNFEQALHQIITNPHENWGNDYLHKPTTQGFRSSAHVQRQIAKGGRRIPLPRQHPLAGKLTSLPERLFLKESKRSTDTPENRFVKFVLDSFRSFLIEMSQQPAIGQGKHERLLTEVNSLIQNIDEILGCDVLRNLSQLDVLPLSSPTLQRREGYREILQAWMNFSLAAKITWNGGDQVYGMGQRNVASLYEYWVFFCLLKIISTVFKLHQPDINKLIISTDNGFSIQLKAGRHQAIKGTCSHFGRKLNVCFSYNRSFKHNRDFTRMGSWTQPMRPDYTLSFWPDGYSEVDAEAQELMVHVHFDAKYRLEQITDLLWKKDSEDLTDSIDQALDEVKQAEESGTYKRADLLKMHAYRDAIRRSHGAYVIYPGNSNDGEPFQTFHEILPGLGAFALRPGAGTQTLEQFLRDVVRHVSDRTTARERQTFQTYKSYSNTTPVVAEEQRAAC